MEWIMEHIIGPKFPSKEVCDYVKKELQMIQIYEHKLDITESERNLLCRTRENIAVFENMYPGLLYKLKSE